MEDEIVIKVEGETPSPETSPVVVVTETPAPAVDSAVVVFTLEQLAERIAVLEAARETDVATIVTLSSEIDSVRMRLVALEVEEIEEVSEPDETAAEIVAEVIPPTVAEVVEDAKPAPRIRKFV